MLQGIIRRRQQALIQAWVRNPLVQVQVESPDALPRLVFIDDPTANGQVSRLGRRGAAKCAIARNGEDRDAGWSVWVAAGYSDYRAAYLAFIREAYGISASTGALAGFDVDHLLNRARSPQASTFIRIEAIPAAANQEWGRLFEKAASNPRFSANQTRERRTMSWMICAKLAGQSPPAGPRDAAGVQRLVAYFRTLGLAESEARDGLQNMLDFAYGVR